jgi:HD-GYP domain-containing protein (c-di-GMP phosphodiesterase class II)
VRADRADGSLRLADLLSAISLITDLGMNLPQDTALRVCLLATRLGRHMHLSEPEVATIYFAALLRFVGCTSYAHEEALLFGGDDLALRRAGASVDFDDPRQVFRFMTSGLPAHTSGAHRAAVVLNRLIRAPRLTADLVASHCEVATRVAQRLGLDASVEQALGQMFERWDGKGGPRRLAREQILPAVRLIHVAHVATILALETGTQSAARIVRERAGGALDPELAAAFSAYSQTLLDDSVAEDVWQTVLGAEPEPHVVASAVDLDRVVRTVADVVDLKVAHLRGHSPGVATLAEQAARGLGCTDDEIDHVRRAALLHDLGRVGVPNGIWERRGTLTMSDWERVRLHAYHTERILSRSAALAPLAPVAGMHHERQDGSGYHRQVAGVAIPLSARILAAADTFAALIEERPHRPAHPAEVAARVLEEEASAGRLDPQAVGGVLMAAGQSARLVRHAAPADLTERELEVLRLVARGSSTREVARRLVISPKTADHHIQHIYSKIGVSTRAAAALFAMEHDLLH